MAIRPRAAAPEIDHALGLLEADRGVEGVARIIVEQRVRRELGAAEGAAPAAGLLGERAGDALPAMAGRDIDALQEQHRRGVAAVHIVVPDRRLGEAHGRARIVTGDEGELLRRVQHRRGAFLQPVAVGPERVAHRHPFGEVGKGAWLDDHASV